MPEQVTHAESIAERSDRDTRDLKRGVFVNLIGNSIKLAHPVLLILLVRAYGTERFGLFTFAQGLVLVVLRIGMLGLDKGLLWWIPRQPAAERLRGVRPTFLLVTTLCLILTPLAALSANATTIRWIGGEPDAVLPLRVMLLGIPLLAWLELLMNATMGRRRMEAQVFVKETLVPLSLVVLALGFYALGFDHVGLAAAFLLAHALGVLVSLRVFRALFRDTPRPDDPGFTPPGPLLRYALPMWGSEFTNSLFQRLDQFLVTFLLGDLETLGIYAVAVNISNAVRAIRRSFDPIVLAIVSEIGVRKDTARLNQAYSSATSLMTITQIPVFVFLLLFAHNLVLLYGPNFGPAALPLTILCAFWLVCSPINLAGIVVTAYGYSRLTLSLLFLVIAVQALLGWLLIPDFGLVGAALAVGLAYTAQGAAQVLAMRKVAGTWGLGFDTLKPLSLGVLAGGLALTAWWLGSLWPVLGHKSLLLRALAFIVFLAVYGVGAARFWPKDTKTRPNTADDPAT